MYAAQQHHDAYEAADVAYFATMDAIYATRDAVIRKADADLETASYAAKATRAKALADADAVWLRTKGRSWDA